MAIILPLTIFLQKLRVFDVNVLFLHLKLGVLSNDDSLIVRLI